MTVPAVPADTAYVAFATVPVILLARIFVIPVPLPMMLVADNVLVVLSKVRFADAPRLPALLNWTWVFDPATVILGTNSVLILVGVPLASTLTN